VHSPPHPRRPAFPHVLCRAHARTRVCL
jgi:hypothetical protein